MSFLKIQYSKTFLLTLSLSVIFSTGCALSHKYEPKKFGASVKTMVKAQIYDRSTINNPPLDVIVGMDSNKAISDLRKIYRKTEASKTDVKELLLPGEQ